MVSHCDLNLQVSGADFKIRQKFAWGTLHLLPTVSLVSLVTILLGFGESCGGGGGSEEPEGPGTL